ncbi:MAG: transposase [Verrucomicrobiota bacterium]
MKSAVFHFTRSGRTTNLLAGMARALRVEYPGAVYHIMARGDQGQSIFADDSDRRRLLETLAEACEKTGWLIHAYVLMGNHYHLLAETPEANLVVGMKWLQGTYTQRYNSRHDIYGHLFQGRYKAIVVDGRDPHYFQVVSTYIHLNPARAGLVQIDDRSLGTYPWSSYPFYLSRSCPKWLCRSRVMASLGLREEDRDRYEANLQRRVLELGMEQGRSELEAQWKALRRGWYFGGEDFYEKLQRMLPKAVKGGRRDSYSGPARLAHDTAAAEELLLRGMRVLGISSADLARMPAGAIEKTALAWWLRGRTVIPLRWVASRLGMGHYTRVSQAVAGMNRNPGGQLRQLRSALLGIPDLEVTK